MRILICDDEEKQLNELKTYIEEYMKKHNIDKIEDIVGKVEMN